MVLFEGHGFGNRLASSQAALLAMTKVMAMLVVTACLGQETPFVWASPLLCRNSTSEDPASPVTAMLGKGSPAIKPPAKC